MNTFLSKFLPFLQKYKYYFILLITLFFIIIFLIFFSPQPEDTNTPTPTPAPTVTEEPLPTLFTEITPTGTSAEDDEGWGDLKSEEKLSDGGIKYSLYSTNASRPNIIQSAADGSLVFQRSVLSPDAPENISDYMETYGQPDQLSTGSLFYGPTAQTYIYAQDGFAIIVDPQTGSIFEIQNFPSMTATEYIQKYGADN